MFRFALCVCRISIPVICPMRITRRQHGRRQVHCKGDVWLPRISEGFRDDPIPGA
jgi:hypothetical protein